MENIAITTDKLIKYTIIIVSTIAVTKIFLAIIFGFLWLIVISIMSSFAGISVEEMLEKIKRIKGYDDS